VLEVWVNLEKLKMRRMMKQKKMRKKKMRMKKLAVSVKEIRYSLGLSQ
jgi:hypothetical protein